MYQDQYQSSSNRQARATNTAGVRYPDDEGFNDRADATSGPTAAGRAEFLAALRGAISETAAGGGLRHDEEEKKADIDCIDPVTGALTSHFREQLQLISEQ